MGTRFYFPLNITAPVSPAYSTEWEYYAIRRWMTYPAVVGTGYGGYGSSETSANAPYDMAIYQYISEPLAAQTISGTVKGQLQAYETASDGDFCRALVIKIVSGDGLTLRGTLLNHFPTTLTSEFSVLPTTANRHFPPQNEVASLSIQTGDRLVIELGVRGFNTTTDLRLAGLMIGDSTDAPDLPEDETTTTTGNAWIEFSHVFQFLDSDSARQVVLNATSKQVTWLFDVDLNANGSVDYRWSNQEASWNGYNYSFRVISFSPLQIPAAEPGFDVIPPAQMTIAIDFHGNSIDGYKARDFVGADILVRLIGSATATTELMTWRFRVISACAVNQVLNLECQDLFTLYLEGDFPLTPLVSELFPGDIMKADNLCVPIIYGTAYIPVRWITSAQAATYVDADTFTVSGNQTALFSAGQFLLAHCGTDGVKSCWVSSSSYESGITTVNLTNTSDDLTTNLTKISTDHYLLGPSDATYTISQARTPREVSFKTTYQSGTYIFKQDTITGADGNPWRVMQLICDDANRDGTNDANGFWGVVGKEIYDLPLKFSRSDLASTTNPADIAASLLQSFGISPSLIDTDSLDDARSTFTARGLTMNIGLWYRQHREKLISKLFTLSGMIPIYRDKIGFKILTKTSQMTIDESMIIPGTFQISRTVTQKQKDSGYVTWQTSDEPVDQVNKSLIAAKSSTDNRSDTTIEAEWILDSVKAQTCAKLALQRILLRDRTINFTGTSRLLFLEPGDMITINSANFGGESSGWDCMITRMAIRPGLLIDIEAVRFSDDLDDWEDISVGELTIDTINTDRSYSPVFQGRIDAQQNTTNQITGTVTVSNGGDISLQGNNTDPGTIRFQGTYQIKMGINADGTSFVIAPDNDNVTDMSIGDPQGWFGGITYRTFHDVIIAANNRITIGKNSGPGAIVDPSADVSYLAHTHVYTGENYRTSKLLLAWDYIQYIFVKNISEYWSQIKFTCWSDDAFSTDEYIDLPVCTSGLVLVTHTSASYAEGGLFAIRSGAGVTKIVGTTYTATTDTAGYLCVFDNGSQVRVKNRFSWEADMISLMWYF